ncbi:hypothetical protein [Poseidonocella sp. HB161398]|uniref:hypothetical protein n=1 Tax=Poseidonocella sp. HB161398 TaxID=2320855 RepID=UPI001109F4E1|nr:hypothetical protein [Poseidonocella sp. HB161398]
MNMIKHDTMGAPAPLSVTVDSLISEHGGWRFLIAAIAGLGRAPMIRRQIDHMPDYLRMDVGLPPKDDPFPSREFMR